MNRDGSIDVAFKPVELAVAAGGDVVKFQTFDVDEVVTAGAPQAGYQRERAPAGSQQAMLHPSFWIVTHTSAWPLTVQNAASSSSRPRSTKADSRI